jgi:hypothetical protein
MPDWLTHTLAGWITGKTIKMDVSLIVAGSLVPDLRYINLGFMELFNVDLHTFLDVLHTPIGAFLIGGIFALFFKDIKKAFMLVAIGITTHYILDFFLVHASGGIRFLFPFSWGEWQFYLIRAEDYRITIFAVIAAIIVYIVYLYHDKIILKKRVEH